LENQEGKKVSQVAEVADDCDSLETPDSYQTTVDEVVMWDKWTLYLDLDFSVSG
jgi:hypothetical protein